MKDTVAIVGSHTATRSDIDFDRTDCDIWVFNEALSKALSPDANEKDKWCKRADAVFQMHDPAVWKNPGNRNDKHHADWLKSGDTPVIYMLEAYPEVPQAVKYPLDEVIANIGGLCGKFVTSSVALAIPLAILNGYKRIEVYGVEMETETEYIYQRDAIGYWFGVCDGMGIELRADLMFMRERYIYGYEGKVTIDLQDFHDRIKELEPARQTAWATYNRANKAYNEFAEQFKLDCKDPDKFIELTQAVGKAMSAAGNLNGAKQLNQIYIDKAEKAKEAADGEYMFVRQEFEQSWQAMVKNHATYMNEMSATIGKAQEIIETVKNTANKGKRLKRVHKYHETVATFMNLAQQVGMFFGGANESKLYAQKLDKLIRAAGGAKSEAAILGGKDGASAANILSQGVTEEKAVA